MGLEIDLENPEVFNCGLTVEQARDLLDLELPDNLTEALDEAQGYVFTGESPRAYLVIEITK